MSKKYNKNRLIGDIIESNLSTEIKVELINKINDKSYFLGVIRYIAIRFYLDYFIDNL